MLKALESKRLRLKYDETLASFVFQIAPLHRGSSPVMMVHTDPDGGLLQGRPKVDPWFTQG
jgi:hypothetical protein